jgi:hypothetical protein
LAWRLLSQLPVSDPGLRGSVRPTAAPLCITVAARIAVAARIIVAAFAADADPIVEADLTAEAAAGGATSADSPPATTSETSTLATRGQCVLAPVTVGESTGHTRAVVREGFLTSRGREANRQALPHAGGRERRAREKA